MISFNEMSGYENRIHELKMTGHTLTIRIFFEFFVFWRVERAVSWATQYIVLTYCLVSTLKIFAPMSFNVNAFHQLHTFVSLIKNNINFLGMNQAILIWISDFSIAYYAH